MQESKTTMTNTAPLKSAPPLLAVAAAILVNTEGEILLAQRPAGKAMAGLWEFPGGKIETGETPEAALVREMAEELGITITLDNLTPFTFASHSYENIHLLMPLYLCRLWNGTPIPQEGQELAWVHPENLGDYPMPPADLPLIPLLQQGVFL